MSHTIYLPTFAAKKEDVQRQLAILQEEVLQKHPSTFDIGLEIGGLPKHFQQGEHLEAIVDNTKSVAAGVKTIVHGFAGLAVYTEGISDMSNDEVGPKLLKTYIDLAKKLGSNYVHVHGSAGFQGIKPLADKFDRLEKIRRNLINGMINSEGIPIGLENLPVPSCCDFYTDPKEVWSDCAQQPEDVQTVIQGTPLKFTFDTAHYGINKPGSIDLVKPVEGLKEHLYHLHVVDCTGFWKANVSKAYDGSIPGDGRIGPDSFQKFFHYIRENHPNLGMCIEVKNDPYYFREGIRRVIKWLSE